MRLYFLIGTVTTLGALGLAIAVASAAVVYGSRPAAAGDGRTGYGAWYSDQAASGDFPLARTAATPQLIDQVAPATLIEVPPPPPEPPARPVATPAPRPAPRPVETNFVQRGRLHNVNITFYSCLGEGFCGSMYNGERVYQGAAACSFDLPLGTAFRIAGDPTGRVYVCKDRGLLDPTWVDIYWYDPSEGWRWQAHVGRWGTIEILESTGR